MTDAERAADEARDVVTRIEEQEATARAAASRAAEALVALDPASPDDEFQKLVAVRDTNRARCEAFAARLVPAQAKLEKALAVLREEQATADAARVAEMEQEVAVKTAALQALVVDFEAKLRTARAEIIQIVNAAGGRIPQRGPWMQHVHNFPAVLDFDSDPIACAARALWAAREDARGVEAARHERERQQRHLEVALSPGGLKTGQHEVQLCTVLTGPFNNDRCVTEPSTLERLI